MADPPEEIQAAVQLTDAYYAECGEATRAQLEDDCDAVTIQRDDLYERLGRIRAAAESDPDLPKPLRDFLLREASEGWLHVTAEMLARFRATGSHHDVEREPTDG